MNPEHCAELVYDPSKPKNTLRQIALVQDDSSHWYCIPVELGDKFDKLLEEDLDKFEEEFNSYRTGGGISHIKLYTYDN